MNKRIAKWGLGGGALLLLLLGTLFALRPAQNQCIPITDEAGLWSAFVPNHYVPIIAPLTPSQIDSDDGGRGYYVGKEYLEAQAPHLLNIVGPPHFEHGLIYPEPEFETYGESHFDGFGFRYRGMTLDNVQTVIDENGLLWFGDGLFDDDEWTTGLVFSTYSNPVDWQTLLGECPFYRVPTRPAVFRCDFKFIDGGLVIDYAIRPEAAHRYREVEDFLKQHVICNVATQSADPS